MSTLKSKHLLYATLAGVVTSCFFYVMHLLSMREMIQHQKLSMSYSWPYFIGGGLVTIIYLGILSVMIDKVDAGMNGPSSEEPGKIIPFKKAG